MSDNQQSEAAAPEAVNDGSLGAAAGLMDIADIGGLDGNQPARAENGKFAKADASGEAVQEQPPQHGDNDKPIEADKADDDAEKPETAEAAEPDSDDGEDWVEIPSDEEGAEPTRYKLTELVEAKSALEETRQELERARQGSPAPADYDIALQETIAIREQYARGVEQWQHYNPVGEPPSMELLNENSANYDPSEYYRQMQGYRQRVQQHQEAQAELQAIERQNAEARETARQNQILRTRDKVAEFWPELRDPTENQRVRQELQDHYGITPERLASVTDPDAFRIMKDALAYRRAAAKQPKALKAVTAKPKLVPAKARQAHVTAKAQKSAEARKRLASTNSVDDAADVLGDFL